MYIISKKMLSVLGFPSDMIENNAPILFRDKNLTEEYKDYNIIMVSFLGFLASTIESMGKFTTTGNEEYG